MLSGITNHQDENYLIKPQAPRPLGEAARPDELIRLDNSDRLELSAEAREYLGNQEKDEELKETGAQLSEDEKRLVDDLKKSDQRVRTHEQAHMAAGGGYAGGAQYQYNVGPDGKQYAVGGEVSIDTSPIPDNPQATIAKMQTVQSAALAPADPSGADRSVAAAASKMAAAARQQMMKKMREESEGESEEILKTPAEEGLKTPAEEGLKIPGEEGLKTPGEKRKTEAEEGLKKSGMANKAEADERVNTTKDRKTETENPEIAKGEIGPRAQLRVQHQVGQTLNFHA